MENNQIILDIEVNETAQAELKSLATWIKINAMIAFLSMALSIATVVLIGIKYQASAASETISKQILSLMISLILNIFLYSAGKQMQEAIAHSNQEKFRGGMSQLAKYFKIIGILFIVLIVVMLLAFLFVLVIGGFGRA
jgi:ABC-type Fe3+ transport system permease subunit